MASPLDTWSTGIELATGGIPLEKGPVDEKRLCPTRTSGALSLIAQWITPTTCLERQRRNYHKCFTCQYQGLSAEAILAPPLKSVPPPMLAPAPEASPLEVSPTT